MVFDILHKDGSLVVIRKPPGFHVHQPEFPRRRVSSDVVCLGNLRDQINAYLFPVHRIDVATEGVLMFALNKETANSLCRQFQEGRVEKTYFAVVRGWTDDEGVIERELALDSTGDLVHARTRYRTRARVELPDAVGKRHPTSRYSLVEAKPETGRFHQVRRHFAGLAHPLVGDCAHGDSHHNRHFRVNLEMPGLWLKAKAISFEHPATGETLNVETAWSPRWLGMFEKLKMEVPTEGERLSQAGRIPKEGANR